MSATLPAAGGSGRGARGGRRWADDHELDPPVAAVSLLGPRAVERARAAEPLDLDPVVGEPQLHQRLAHPGGALGAQPLVVAVGATSVGVALDHHPLPPRVLLPEGD